MFFHFLGEHVFRGYFMPKKLFFLKIYPEQPPTSFTKMSSPAPISRQGSMMTEQRLLESTMNGCYDDIEYEIKRRDYLKQLSTEQLQLRLLHLEGSDNCLGIVVDYEGEIRANLDVLDRCCGVMEYCGLMETRDMLLDERDHLRDELVARGVLKWVGDVPKPQPAVAWLIRG